MCSTNEIVRNAVEAAKSKALNFSLSSFNRQIEELTKGDIHGYSLDAVEREVKKASGDIAKVCGSGGIVSRILSAVAEARKALKASVDEKYGKIYKGNVPADYYRKSSIPQGSAAAKKLKDAAFDLYKVYNVMKEREAIKKEHERWKRENRKFNRDFERENGDYLRKLSGYGRL